MPEFPFVYLNHGPLDPDTFGKADGAWIAFREPASEMDLAFAARTCPEPIHGFFQGDDGLFYCESPGDVYQFMVAEGWGAGYAASGYCVTEEAAAAFSAEVERWVLGVHQGTPIAFFMGPGATLGEDPWETWSRQQVATIVVPWLERYLDAHPDLPLGDPDDEADDLDGDAGADDEGGDWPVTPMNRDTLSSISYEIDTDEGERSPEQARRLATLISRLVDLRGLKGQSACSERERLSILVMCWSYGRIASAATGTSTRHPRTCSSARTSAPGAATARRTSCTAFARTVAANSSGAPSGRPACS